MGKSLRGIEHTNSSGKIISVTSGKGGVGKSNLSIFLGRALSALGKKILIFDGDMGLANLHILLGLGNVKTVADFFLHKYPLKDIAAPLTDSVDILSGASGNSALANLSDSQIQYFTDEISSFSSRYDYLLIDGGAGISKATISLAAAGNMPLVVLTPEPTSLTDAYAVIKLLSRQGKKDFYVIVNMADTYAEAAQVYEQLEKICDRYLGIALHLLGILPHTQKIRSCIRDDRSLMELHELGDYTLRLNAIAQKIVRTL
jgi:flagellar biosynthesis protein FlhG